MLSKNVLSTKRMKYFLEKEVQRYEILIFWLAGENKPFWLY